MKIIVIPVTAFQQNCSLLWCEKSMEAVVVDPGGDLDEILSAAVKAGVKLIKILLTHGHVDHAGGAKDLALRLNIPIFGPQKEDQFWIDQLPKQCLMFGLPESQSFTPDHWLEGGDKVSFGHEQLEVIHCPGHTPGHVVYFHRGERLALVGDVLFKGSIGRTDFPRGNYQLLIDSIHEKLLPLGDDVVFISGHGPSSTFGAERVSNPFLVDSA